jgi:hypothetical protein
MAGAMPKPSGATSRPIRANEGMVRPIAVTLLASVPDYLAERWQVILFSSWQHLWLVIQCLALATVLAVGRR